MAGSSIGVIVAAAFCCSCNWCLHIATAAECMWCSTMSFAHLNGMYESPSCTMVGTEAKVRTEYSRMTLLKYRIFFSNSLAFVN